MSGTFPGQAGPNAVALVEDDDILRDATAQALALAGLEPIPLGSAAEALRVVNADFRGIVVSDIRMPGMDGLELFDRLRALDAELPVILITGHGDIPTAVDAVRRGAYDFLSKPCPTERLLLTVRQAMEKRGLVLENRRLRAGLEEAEGGAPMLGETPSMIRLRQSIAEVARLDVDILLVGETGTGKEVGAHMLHRLGPRRTHPFVALNCGAIPESMMESELFGHEAGAFTGAARRRIGRVEHAHRGTLFLDELESMPPALQVRFLRVLEAREVMPLGSNEVRTLDFRVVAAAKSDLAEAAKRGEFRLDLFHRLDVVTLRLPPLRERRDDIPLLFAHFAALAAARFRREPPPVSPLLLDHLMRHDWPGNIRELRHFAERSTLGLNLDLQVGREAKVELAASAEDDITLSARMERFEAEQIRQVLSRCGGDVRDALRLLGLPRKTFYDKLARHGINRTVYAAFHPER